MTLATIMLGSALCAWTTPTDVNFHTLENGRLKMKVADVGGRIMELWAPDKDGNLADVAVAFENPNDYNTTDYYLGPIIGHLYHFTEVTCPLHGSVIFICKT